MLPLFEALMIQIALLGFFGFEVIVNNALKKIAFKTALKKSLIFYDSLHIFLKAEVTPSKMVSKKINHYFFFCTILVEVT